MKNIILTIGLSGTAIGLIIASTISTAQESKKQLNQSETIHELTTLPIFQGINPTIYRFVDKGNTCYIVRGGHESVSIFCIK